MGATLQKTAKVKAFKTSFIYIQVPLKIAKELEAIINVYFPSKKTDLPCPPYPLKQSRMPAKQMHITLLSGVKGSAIDVASRLRDMDYDLMFASVSHAQKSFKVWTEDISYWSDDKRDTVFFPCATDDRNIHRLKHVLQECLTVREQEQQFVPHVTGVFCKRGKSVKRITKGNYKKKRANESWKVDHIVINDGYEKVKLTF